jgi:hypothetical protein
MKQIIISLLLTVLLLPVFGQTDTSEIIRKCKYKHSQTYEEQEQNIQTLGMMKTQDSYLTIAKYLLSNRYERLNLTDLDDNVLHTSLSFSIKDTIPEDYTDTIVYEALDPILLELEEKRIMEEMTKDRYVRRYVYVEAEMWICSLKNQEMNVFREEYLDLFYETDSNKHYKSTKNIRKRMYKWMKTNYGRYEFPDI